VRVSFARRTICTTAATFAGQTMTSGSGPTRPSLADRFKIGALSWLYVRRSRSDSETFAPPTMPRSRSRVSVVAWLGERVIFVFSRKVRVFSRRQSRHLRVLPRCVDRQVLRSERGDVVQSHETKPAPVGRMQFATELFNVGASRGAAINER
jgi:hypothetical protein